MKSFYEGFEKRAQKLVKPIDAMWKGIKKGYGFVSREGKKINKSRVENFGMISEKELKDAVGESADVAINKIKKDLVPELNKLIDKAHKKGVGVDLSSLKTFKGGILPAAGVGVGFEAGRQAMNAATKFPSYAQKKRQDYQKNKG